MLFRARRIIYTVFAFASWVSLLKIVLAHHATAAALFSFAVIGDVPFNADEERQTHTFLAALSRERGLKVVIHNGNVKRPDEACVDQVFKARRVLFEESSVPLVYIPGTNDWINCHTAPVAYSDAVAQLDGLREYFFDARASFGKTRLSLIRQSDGARFSAYRENIRWEIDGVVFVGLNVPGANNHYLNRGGRNGEFEERVIANRAWLEQAGQAAQQRTARALVIVIHGNPHFELEKPPQRLGWLRAQLPVTRDGYREFRRDVLKLAQRFAGPILLIHREQRAAAQPSAAAPPLFSVDVPLRSHSGAAVNNLTRLAIARLPSSKWLQVTVQAGRRKPFFEIRLRDMPPAYEPVEEPKPSPPQESESPLVEALPADVPMLVPTPSFDQGRKADPPNIPEHPASNLPW